MELLRIGEFISPKAPCLKKVLIIYHNGHSREDPSPPPPKEDISIVLKGRGEKFISDNCKCITTSEEVREGFQFPLWNDPTIIIFILLLFCQFKLFIILNFFNIS